MTSSDIQALHRDIIRATLSGYTGKATNLSTQLLTEAARVDPTEGGKLLADFEAIKSNLLYTFRYLLQESCTDSAEQIDALKCQMLECADRGYHTLMAQSDAYYYRTRRIALSIVSSSLEEFTNAISQLEEAHQAESIGEMLSQTGISSQSSKMTAREHDVLADKAFMMLFVEPYFSPSLADQARQAILERQISVADKALLVAAIMMSAIQAYDSRKIDIIIDCTSSRQPLIAGRAFVALALCSLLYNSRMSLEPTLQRKLTEKAKRHTFTESIEMAMSQLIRGKYTSTETSELEKKILSEVKRITPKLSDLLKDFDQTKFLETEAQSIEEVLADSKMTDDISSFIKKQQDGEDIFIEQFRMSPLLPFFNTLSHWFTPFSIHNSHIKNGDSLLDSICHTILTSPTMCDNDKYLTAISMGDFAQQNLANIGNTLNLGQIKDLPQIEDTVKYSIMRFCFDLYRFHTLSAFKGSFPNPFKSSLHFSSIALTAYLSAEQQQKISSLYFKKCDFEEALAFLRKFEEEKQIDKCNFKEVAFCYQQTERYDEAIRYYKRVLLTDEQDTWTLSRLGFCYSKLGYTDKAIETYKILTSIEPKKTQHRKKLILSYIENNDYKNAIQELYYIEFNLGQDESPAMLSLMSRCLFQNGDLEKAKSYIIRIKSEDLSADDYITNGNISFVSKKYDDAIVHYRKASSNSKNKCYSIQEITNLIRENETTFSSYGISKQRLETFISYFLLVAGDEA